MKDFKDNQERWRTTSLFFELATRSMRKAFSCPFTTKDQDHTYKGETYVSLKQRYVELGDPTEYEFANLYLGGWQHWKRIINSPQLAAWVAECREELKFKLMAEGVKVMRTKAAEGNVTAAKELMTKGWVVEDKKGRGRPSKEEVDGIKKHIALEEVAHESDLKRVLQ